MLTRNYNLFRQSTILLWLFIAVCSIVSACKKTSDNPIQTEPESSISALFTSKEMWPMEAGRVFMPQNFNDWGADYKFNQAHPNLSGTIRFKNDGTFSVTDANKAMHSGTWKEVADSTVSITGLFPDAFPDMLEWEVEELPDAGGGYWYVLTSIVEVQDTAVKAYRYDLFLY